jgi:hypothetical protein
MPDYYYHARTEFVSKEMKKDFKAGIKVSDLRMG